MTDDPIAADARAAVPDYGVYGPLHIGRSWSGHPLEDACPCVKASCGLVEKEDPSCDQHGMKAAKTIRQQHFAGQCPGPDFRVTEQEAIQATDGDYLALLERMVVQGTQRNDPTLAVAISIELLGRLVAEVQASRFRLRTLGRTL